jgi:hypothetical protein
MPTMPPSSTAQGFRVRNRTAARRTLSITEFCEAAGISRRLFYHLVNAGRIRVLRLSSRPLVPVSELERILASAAFVPCEMEDV